MKKTLITLMIILTLISFGTVSSAYAFVDLVSLTLIIGTGFFALVTGAELSKHPKEEPVVATKAAPDQKKEVKPDKIPNLAVVSPG